MNNLDEVEKRLYKRNKEYLKDELRAKMKKKFKGMSKGQLLDMLAFLVVENKNLKKSMEVKPIEN